VDDVHPSRVRFFVAVADYRRAHDGDWNPSPVRIQVRFGERLREDVGVDLVAFDAARKMSTRIMARGQSFLPK
jgi:hypothetical protein